MHILDNEVQAVLDEYHDLIREEKSRKRDPSLPKDDGRHRFMAVGPDTGQLINIFARSQKAPTILELGTSFGYSTIWLADAARTSGGRVITMERFDTKSEFARKMADKAGLVEHIEFQVGDAVEMIGQLDTKIDFVLLDLYKDLYVPCLEAFYPRLNPGAIIVADNMISSASPGIKEYETVVRAKPGISSLLLPVGSGLEVSRYEP